MATGWRRVTQVAPARLARVPVDTARALVAHASGQQRDGAVRPRTSFPLAASVAIDEAIVGLMKGPGMFPSREEYQQFSDALVDTWGVFLRKGWVDDPSSFHTEPPPAQFNDVITRRHRRLPYDSARFESGFDLPADMAGLDTWRSWEGTATARVRLVRHPGSPDRPWVVAIHGIGMGRRTMDFPMLRVNELHHDLGYNVAMPILPAHGDRAATTIGSDFMSKDLVQTVACAAQAVWEVRRVIGWIRATHPDAPVAVTGISLGGLVAALVGSLDPGLTRVVAGFPVVDVQWVIRRHTPRHLHRWAKAYGLQGSVSDEVARVINPLALRPALSPDRLRIVAGTADRFTGTGGTRRLARHWGVDAHWVNAGHVGGILRGGDRVVTALEGLDDQLPRVDAASVSTPGVSP